MTQTNQPAGHPEQADPSRRRILTVAAAVGTAGLVGACGGGEDPAAEASVTPSGTTEAPTTASSSAPPAAGGEALTPTADVPVGSGVILADAKVVVTQPRAGEFKAFSSTCTHMGCQLSGFSDDRITCPCHSSSFSISDGSPRGGPARSPLTAIAVEVEGTNVVRA